MALFPQEPDFLDVRSRDGQLLREDGEWQLGCEKPPLWPPQLSSWALGSLLQGLELCLWARKGLGPRCPEPRLPCCY